MGQSHDFVVVGAGVYGLVAALGSGRFQLVDTRAAES